MGGGLFLRFLVGALISSASKLLRIANFFGELGWLFLGIKKAADSCFLEDMDYFF